MSTEIANTILQQLGNKFVVMTGAKQFLALDDGLQFKIGRNSKNINTVTITLNEMDTYDMTFEQVRMNRKTFEFTRKIIAESAGIYCDMLHRIFETETGLYTSL